MITFNNHTAQDAINILRENAAYIDDTIMDLPTQALKVRLNEMEEAIRVLKHFGGIK